MKFFAPDYYKDFSCIADRCKHNCCIGWEIDIDDETFKYYKSVTGDFGKRLKENISKEDAPHFRLGTDQRCPFLNKDNLCDIILELGENCLCQICADHPRFRNFFNSRTETGLGLCCEEAARLILSRKEKTKIIELEDDGNEDIADGEEQWFFSLRDRVFGIIQNREMPIEKRIETLLHDFDIEFKDCSAFELADIFLDLERLDENWTKKLEELKTLPLGDFDGAEFETVFEQLLVYFIYRHFSEGLYDGRLKERLALSVLGYRMIHNLSKVHYGRCGKIEIEDITEIARMYSSEVEYSEENMEELLEILGG